MNDESGSATIERKFCLPEIALFLGDDMRISGYASIFGEVDQGGDIVAAGAYSASLAAMARAGRRAKMLWQHDPTQPVGVWDEVREDAKGLWVSGRILEGVARGREAAALIGAGAIEGLSIGYRTQRAQKDAQGRRVLSQLELWEVSLVTFPMQQTARVSGKADDATAHALRDVAHALRAAGRILGAR